MNEPAVAAPLHQLPGNLAYVNTPPPPTSNPRIDDIIIGAGRHNVGLSAAVIYGLTVRRLSGPRRKPQRLLKTGGAQPQPQLGLIGAKHQSSGIGHQSINQSKKKKKTLRDSCEPGRPAFASGSFQMAAINTHALSECDYDLDLCRVRVRAATRPASDALIGEPELNKQGAEKGDSCTYEVFSFSFFF